MFFCVKTKKKKKKDPPCDEWGYVSASEVSSQSSEDDESDEQDEVMMNAGDSDYDESDVNVGCRVCHRLNIAHTYIHCWKLFKIKTLFIVYIFIIIAALENVLR